MTPLKEMKRLIFLDTEFTSLNMDTELLSLGMIDIHGETLYLERTDYRIEECSDFVKAVVLPLFGQYPDAQCSLSEFGPRISDWLCRGKESSVIAVDHSFDWTFFYEAMFGCRWPAGLAGRPLLVEGLPFSERKAFHDEHGLPEHHALNDAKSLRHAYISLNSSQSHARRLSSSIARHLARPFG